MVDTWESMKFTVQRYFKGTQERGSVLGAVDDILQSLDDNAMNLQSMAGSRFVGPFLSTVQQWEKSLSMISEVIEVSLTIWEDHEVAGSNPPRAQDRDCLLDEPMA